MDIRKFIGNGKGKGKFVPVLKNHSHQEDIWESGGIGTPFFTSTLDRGESTRPLYPWGKSPWYQLDRRMGGSQNLRGCCEE
jgi:hypothetical protein